VLAGGVRADDCLDWAFGWACDKGSLALIETLLAAGANVNFESRPLLYAVENNRLEVVSLLLKAGARPDIRVRSDHYGERGYAYARKRLLELALAEGLTQVAQMLQAAGATLPVKKNHPAVPLSVTASWRRIDRWLTEHAPGWQPLRPGASEQEIRETEKALGMVLPDDIRDSYRVHDGSTPGGFFPTGLRCLLLPLTGIVRAWTMWKGLVESGTFEDSHPRFVAPGVRRDWWNTGWVPFTSNGGGDCDCVDLAPTRGGKVGQIITMNHETGEHRLLALSLRDWLHQFANDLEDDVYQFEDGGLV
jgi:cell wall assembly regulator SMI1